MQEEVWWIWTLLREFRQVNFTFLDLNFLIYKMTRFVSKFHEFSGSFRDFGGMELPWIGGLLWSQAAKVL